MSISPVNVRPPPAMILVFGLRSVEIGSFEILSIVFPWIFGARIAIGKTPYRE
jgi:hypothetical protein